MNIYNYTEGDTFIYNLSTYTGYYSIKDGIAYIGRYITDASVQLQNQSNILNEFIVNEGYFNYTPLTDVSLPYNEQDIVFSSNEIVNANSINLKIGKIISNFFDLYRRCSTLTNDLPNGYTVYASVTSNGGTSLNWRPLTASGAFNIQSINTQLTATSDILLIKNFNDDNINVVTQTPSAYFIFNFDRYFNTFKVVASASIVDAISQINFSNISSIDSDSSGNLYIADKGNKQVYKISINSTLNNSRVSLNNPKLAYTIGDLVEPSVVRYIDDLLYVYDRSSYTIYIYNLKMTFVTKYVNSKVFQTNEPCYIEKDVNGNLYVLTKTGLIIKSTPLLDSTVEIIDTDIVLGVSEYCKKIKISYNDSNIVYISTNVNVFKLFLNKLQNRVGKFIWSNTTISSVSNLSFSNIITNDNFDYIMIYDTNKFMLFKEHNNLISTLEKNHFSIYNESNIFLQKDYINNITFNRMLYKLIYNHDIFVSFLQSKLSYKYTNYDLLLDSVSVVTVDDVSNIGKEKTLDYFVGVNENISPQVINRVFKKLLEYQQTILSVIQPTIINTKYSTTQVIPFN